MQEVMAGLADLLKVCKIKFSPKFILKSSTHQFKFQSWFINWEHQIELLNNFRIEIQADN